MKIKRSILTLVALILATLVWQGCNKAEDELTGALDFGMNPLIENALKSVSNAHYDVEAALVTIVNEFGEKVYDKEYLEFYFFGESFVTKSLKLKTGNFKLTEFMLVDTSGNVTWATPLEGSRLAGLVNDPLPIEFSVYEGNTTHLYPEVVRVSGHNPNDFGYVNFRVNFVDNFCIGVFFESLCSTWYLDSFMLMEDDFSGPFYPSRILIFGNGELLEESYLIPGENKVAIPRGFREYKIVVYDCGDEPCFAETFGLEELKNFSCSGGEFLFITCTPGIPEIIITPEDVLEPSIEQGVFGKITQAYWDSVGYEDNMVYPLVADLYIYKMEVGDTIYYPVAEYDCLVHPDMYIEPFAIVRSNSSGYFQLPLEQGAYSYMVQTPYGFYIDAYVSSHMPGVFKVVDGQITYLNIHVQPCWWY